MNKTKTLFFVPIKNKNGRLTIQSAAAHSLDEAIAHVLANPVMEDIVSYCRVESETERKWINIDEQN